jgi:hypothetical protein
MNSHQQSIKKGHKKKEKEKRRKKEYLLRELMNMEASNLPSQLASYDAKGKDNRAE